MRARGEPTRDPEAYPFSRQILEDRARRLSEEPFAVPEAAMPPWMQNLSYADYRQINYDAEQALWRGEGRGAEVQFFHLGYLFKEPVHVYEVVEGQARLIQFSPELFDYRRLEPGEPMGEGAGFAGFRVHGPLNQPGVMDEIVAFLGASYFRALGSGQLYGLSARGLAVDTAVSSGEEFPMFRDFWIERPAEGGQALRIHALLDSQRITGALSFDIAPGEQTVMEVDTIFFPRAGIERLGIAPLTSMFFFGKQDAPDRIDYRSEVHDSDGLEVLTGAGEPIWRPLVNPTRLRISAFGDENPKRFGLLQRERRFDAYQDLGAGYERRPSAWVEPIGEWGRGAVMLVEIPTDLEANDNIVAFWTPAGAIEAGSEHRFAYRLVWGNAPPIRVARAVSTRVGLGGVSGVEPDEDSRRVVIDFSGGQLSALEQVDGLKPEFSVSKGQVEELHIGRNPHVEGVRVGFDLRPEGSDPVEVRLFLTFEGERLSETWSFQWTP